MLPATDHTASYAKGESGDQRRGENVWYLNAQQWVQSRKGVAGVGVRWQRHRVGASKTNEGSKTMRGIRRHTKIEQIWPKPGRPESNKAWTRARAEEAMLSSTCIALVKVARFCGIHQQTRRCVDVGSGLR